MGSNPNQPQLTENERAQQYRDALRANVPDSAVAGLVKLCQANVEHSHVRYVKKDDGTEERIETPCTRNRGKRPVGVGWNKKAVEQYGRYKDGSLHLPSLREQAIDWLMQGFGVGWCPPPGYAILDADNLAADDWLSERLTAAYPTARRKPGRAHYLMRYDAEELDLKAKAIHWGDGDEEHKMDIRVGGKSQVAVAPSLHNDGENHYAPFEPPIPTDLETVPYITPDIASHLRGFLGRTRSDTGRSVGEIPGHDRLRGYVNRQCRYASFGGGDAARERHSLDEVRRKAVAYAGEVYADRPDRAAETCEAGGEIDRLIVSGWELFGAANPLDEDKSDAGYVELIEATFGTRWLYAVDLKQWFEYDGVVWEPTFSEMLGDRLIGFAESLFEDATKEMANPARRERLLKMHKQLRTNSKVDSIVRAMSKRYAVTSSRFDQDPMLLNFPAHGVWEAVTLDLRTGKTRDPRKEDYITKKMAGPYIEGATHEAWNMFLDGALPDLELRAFVQRGIGVSLAGETREHRLFFMYGRGGTGKSTFLRAVHHALGDYSVSVAFDMLTDRSRSSQSASPDVASLRGARYGFCSEIPERTRLGARLKDLTGGDPIQARVLYGSPFTFEPQHTLWVAGNTEPQADYLDSGVWRRLVQIPMDQVCASPDPGLAATLTEPMAVAALIQWALRGWQQYGEHGLGSCAQVEQATLEMRLRANPLEEWFLEECATGPGEELASEMYSAYRNWTSDQLGRLVTNSDGLLSRKKFSALLREKGITSKRGSENKTYYVGVRLLKKSYRSDFSDGSPRVLK